MAGGTPISPDAPCGEVTKQLLAWSAGSGHAAATAFATLHATLRQLAKRMLAGERTAHTLETSGLISEAFVRLLEQQHVEWRSREHFIAIAAQMMRRILIDHARRRRTAKRGGDAQTIIDLTWMTDESLGELVAIHDALKALADVDRMQSEIVELRFFGGMTHDEIANYLDISVATVERRWRQARAWLYRHLARAD